MLTVETRPAIDPAAARSFDTEALRAHFQIAGIFRPGEIRLIYTHYDRMIVGGAVPAGAPLTLDRVAEAGTPSVLDRREMVVVNIGGDGTVSAALKRVGEAGIASSDLREFFASALISPVLTAHPTEVRRKSTIDREMEVAQLLAERDRVALTPEEEARSDEALRRAVLILWQTSILRRHRLRVIDEVMNGLSYYDYTFLREVPRLHCALEDRLNEGEGAARGELASFLKMGSWIGGDRDGNPFVTAEVMRGTLKLHASRILRFYLEELHVLGSELSMAAHLGAIALLWWAFGFSAALRTSIIPVFFVFPVAFTLNRLGQHYDIDPEDPAKWGTLMRGHWFWDFAFLNSNYHLEHHYFPGVPFYRLPALQGALVPFYERKQLRWQSYGRLVYGWIVENQAPHTDWSHGSHGNVRISTDLTTRRPTG